MPWNRVLVLGRRRRSGRTRAAVLEVSARPGPRVVVVEGAGWLALAACAYRFGARGSELHVYLREPPRPSSWLARRILGSADGIVVDGDAAFRAVSRLGLPTKRLAAGGGLDPFLSVMPSPQPPRTRHITMVGELSPQSGAYDLLANLAVWSRANAEQTLALSWVGQGDLAGMLAAQPLPANLSQTFHGALSPREIAALLAQSSILAVPSVADDVGGCVAEALAAGVPVAGSRRNGEVRRHVTDGVTGWLFDPLTPGDMLEAVGRALDAPAHRLAEMRPWARAAVAVPPAAMHVERARHGARRDFGVMNASVQSAR